jgi:tRNA 2-selenouridine synthase
MERRVDVLLDIYGDLPAEGLAESFRRITKRLGSERTADALEALQSGDLREAARIALSYYDKTYDYGLSKRTDAQLNWLAMGEDSLETLTERARALAKRLTEDS